jgi:hypothetical protein
MKLPHLIFTLILNTSILPVYGASAADVSLDASPEDIPGFSWGAGARPVDLPPTLTARERHRCVIRALNRNKHALLEKFASADVQTPANWISLWFWRMADVYGDFRDNPGIATIKSRVSDWTADEIADVCAGVEAVGVVGSTTSDCFRWIDLVTQRRGPHRKSYLSIALGMRPHAASPELMRHILTLMAAIQETADSEGEHGEDRTGIRAPCFFSMQAAAFESMARARGHPDETTYRDAITGAVNEVLTRHAEPHSILLREATERLRTARVALAGLRDTDGGDSEPSVLRLTSEEPRLAVR